jgi:TonB family protein
VFVFLASLGLFGQATLKWQEFRADADGLSLQVPFQLEMSGDAKPGTSRFYHGQGNRTWLFVFSERAKKEARIRSVRRYVEANGRALTFGPDSTKPVVLSFKDGDGYWNSIAAFISNGREFVLHGVSDESERSIVEKFTSKFKLDDQQTSTTADDASDDSQVQAQPTAAGTTGSGQALGAGKSGSSGQGSGIGTGFGSGRGNSNGASVPENHQVKGASSALRILSKAKPGFTEFARAYDMSGHVLLRVTFLKSGEIGSVSVIQGLPFGLTQAAINAAKRLTFEPAMIDGSPITVTKSVDYSFTLY